MDITDKTEELLQKPAYLIDIFPKTVPYREDGRYFKVERILAREKAETHRRFIRLILKLYCYHDVDVLTDSRRLAVPDPEELESLLVRFFGCGDLPAGDGSGVLRGGWGHVYQHGSAAAKHSADQGIGPDD